MSEDGTGATARTAKDSPILETEAAAREYIAAQCNSAAMERLDAFAAMLLKANREQNLISRASESALWLRHFADSAQLLDHVPRGTMASKENLTWLDLGSGAGFPGLVVAALLPESNVVLVESRTKRAEFLRKAVSELGLVRCSVIGDRLERIEPFAASIISARAFAPLGKLLRLSAPFSTKATHYLLPKGRTAAQELSEQKAEIRKMFHVEQSLTDHDAGIIVTNAQ